MRQGIDTEGFREESRGEAHGEPHVPLRYAFLIIFVVVTAAIAPIAFLGIPDGYDLLQHIRFAAAYHDAILRWELVPGWAGDDNHGFGSIGIRYYPPAAYYLLALTKMAMGNWYDSFWITSFLWMFLGAAGVYFWVREWASAWQPTIAAVLYVLAPYHTFQIYQVVLYAEFAAAGVLPWCFLFLTRLCRRQRWIDTALFSIAYSLLILTHIPSTIIASMCMAVYVPMIIDWRQFTATAVRIGTAMAATLLATLFHLSKALTEMEWVLHNSQQYFANGYYDYKRYFFPIFLTSPAVRYTEKMLWLIDLLDLLTLLLFVPAIAFLIWDRVTSRSYLAGRKFDRAIVLTGMFSIFMLSTASMFIWNHLSVLQKVQFPWRWLIAATLFGSASLAIVIQRGLAGGASRQKRTMGYPLLAFVLVLLMFDVTQNILPSAPLARANFDRNVKNMNNEDGCSCWWPIWATSEAFGRTEQASAGPRAANVDNWQNESRTVSVEAGESTNLRVATFFHPHWNATVNGEPVSVEKDDSGVILVPLPAEAATVQLSFTEPSFLGAAKVISLMTWLLFTAFLIGYYLNTRKRINGIF